MQLAIAVRATMRIIRLPPVTLASGYAIGTCGEDLRGNANFPTAGMTRADLT
jgi:hypothetical protein